MRVRGAAIVTGGGSGIGRALALRLASRGFALVVVDRDPVRTAQTLATVHARGGTGWGEVCDVREEERMRSLAARVEAEHGPIHYLILAAGVAPHGEFALQREDVRKGTLSINLEGVLASVAAVFPYMAARRSGRIVAVASLAGLMPVPGMAAYSASKAAVVSFMRAFRTEAARDGVGVTVACPGPVATRIRQTTAEVLDLPLRADPDPWFMRRLAPDACAVRILSGADRNAALVLLPCTARLAWLLYRLLPASAVDLLGGRLLVLATGHGPEDPGRAHSHAPGVEEEGGASQHQ